MKMKISNTLFLLGCVAVMVGCGGQEKPKVDPVAYAQKLGDGTYEVQLRYSVRTYGGPCNLSFTPTTSLDTNWLYLKSVEGVLNANQVIVTTENGKRDYPYATKDMRGTISFDKSQMTVQLEHPSYPDGVHMQGYMPYSLNGTYKMSAK